MATDQALASPMTTRDETRTMHDPFLNREVKISDKLIDRLRGRYACGPIMPNGEPEFGWREFEVPPIQHEAASALEAKDAEIARLRDIMVDAGDLIIRQQEWQTYGEQLERDADAAMAIEIQEQRKKNAALRDRISDLERQLAEETERNRWRPIETAPLGEMVLCWHPMWRHEFAGQRNGDNGAVYIDTCETEAMGRQDYATHWMPLRAAAIRGGAK